MAAAAVRAPNPCTAILAGLGMAAYGAMAKGEPSWRASALSCLGVGWALAMGGCARLAGATALGLALCVGCTALAAWEAWTAGAAGPGPEPARRGAARGRGEQ